MSAVCGQIYLTTEFSSRIDGVISFGSKPGKFSIPHLPPFGTSSVRLHKLKEFFSQYRSSKINVYLNGNLTNISLTPRHLLKEYVRVVFEFENIDDVVEGKTSLVVKGLVEQNGDLLARISCRFMLRKPSRKYDKRETTLGLEVIGTAIVEDVNQVANESSTRQGNTPDVVEVTDDPIDDPILGSTPTDDRRLTYYKPSIINGIMLGEISDNDLDKDQVRIWEGALICFIGHEILIEEIKEEWKDFEPLEIQEVADGFIAVRFTDERSKFKVFEQGQWFIKDKPLIMKIWSPDIVYDPRSFLVKLPLWIKKLHGLNEACRTRGFLSSVCSTIGVPLFMDETTFCKTNSNFARVCVEVDAREELKEIVHFKWNGNLTHAYVDYEWKPDICSLCLAESPHLNMNNVSPPELILHQNIDMTPQEIAWPVNHRAPVSVVGVGKYLLFLIMVIIALLGDVTSGHPLDWRS